MTAPGPYSPRSAACSLGVDSVERGLDREGSDFASAIGLVICHLEDISKAGVRDRAVGVSVLLLLGDGAVLVEADGVVLLVVRGVAIDLVLIPALFKFIDEFNKLV